MPNKSPRFCLNIDDYSKGLITAAIAGLVFGLVTIFKQSTFDVFNPDWHTVINVTMNAMFASLIGYLGKNFLTDHEGNMV